MIQLIFSSNEKLVVNYLSFDEYISAKELSNKMFVSTKTIYRLVNKINNLLLAEYDEKLIDSEPGKGYKLSSFYINKNISSLLGYQELDEINKIILNLLFKHPKRIILKEALSTDYLSESTIERRIKSIKEHLSSFNIHLHYDADYIWVSGSEQALRKTINKLSAKHNTYSYLGNAGININHFDEKFINKQINIVEKGLRETLNYPYDVTLITHIYMLIKRYREGTVEKFSHQEPLSIEEKELMKNSKNIVNVSQEIIDNISNYIQVELHELEMFFLFQNITSFNIQQRTCNSKDKLIAQDITKKLINDFFSASVEGNENNYSSLYEDLIQHIVPMLSRLRNGIVVENNMLQDVIFKYKDTFQKLRKSTEMINNILPFSNKISDADIGYLTLYFEKYIFTKRKKTRILLVCSSGVGTSELLKIRLNDKFPEINITKTMSKRQMLKYENYIKSEIDAIVTTIKLEGSFMSIPILTISPLLLANDIEKINHLLKEM